MSWSHGYYAGGGYTFGCYREMAPDWMRFAALVNGYRPAPPEPGFRYLELGCGQGAALALLAAAFPEGEFVGVDFNPAHVVQARRFAQRAGLDNVRYEEADFVELAAGWPADLGRFGFVAAHGILSWVNPEVRAALVRCLWHATAPGALVYLSYNCMPGWVAGTVIHELARQMHALSPGGGETALFGQVSDTLDALLAAPSVTASALPGLQARVQGLRAAGLNYLSHEYLHAHWEPLWHARVAEQLAAEARLGHVGSATLAENFLPQRLPTALAEVVAPVTQPALRQTLIDVAINQAFRRDLFARGLTPSDRAVADLGEHWLVALREIPATLKDVETHFGRLPLDESAVAAFAAALADGPERLATLALREGLRELPRIAVYQIATLLLHSGHVALCTRGVPAERAQRFNRAVVASALDEGLPYANLLSRQTASGWITADYELALHAGVAGQQPPPSEALAAQLLNRLQDCGRRLLKEGQPIESEEDQLAQARTLAETFVTRTLPRWQALGIA